MIRNHDRSGFLQVKMAMLATLITFGNASAQSESDSNDDNAEPSNQPLVILSSSGRSRGSYNLLSSGSDGPRMLLLGGGAAAEPVVVNMDGPGYLITCGENSGGASVAYEFVASEPRAAAGPDPRSEAAIRRLSEEFSRGEPNYDLMTPCMTGTTRAQLERLQRQFTSLGPIETVTFDEDWSARGTDTFDVEYANGDLTWMIALTPDGLASMWMFHERG